MSIKIEIKIKYCFLKHELDFQNYFNQLIVNQKFKKFNFLNLNKKIYSNLQKFPESNNNLYKKKIFKLNKKIF